MKRHFRRHLLGGNAVAWPIEASRDGVVQLRAQKGDDETLFVGTLVKVGLGEVSTT